jgi:hypothetical protein
VPEQDHVLGFRDEHRRGEVRRDVFAHGREVVDAEPLEGLDGWEVGAPPIRIVVPADSRSAT